MNLNFARPKFEEFKKVINITEKVQELNRKCFK